MSLSKVLYRVVRACRHNEVLNLIETSVREQDPISKCLGKGPGEALRKYHLASLQENASIMAIDPISDKVVGCVVSRITSRKDWSVPIEEQLACVRHESLSHHFRMSDLAAKASGVDMFEEFGDDYVFQIDMICVERDYQNRGLAFEMGVRVLDFAQALGLKGCQLDATGMYSRKAAERSGLVVRGEYLYEDYEWEGVKILKNMDKAHKSLAFMTRKF